MPHTPDNTAARTNNSGYPFHPHRARSRALDAIQSRGRNGSRYESGRRDRNGERITRIYPRELAKSSPTATRYASPSSPTTSPLMSALGSGTSTAAQYTSDWAKSIPLFAGQRPPNNGVATSASPPSHVSLSNSPPTVGTRPLSHPNQYTSFGGRLQRSPQQSPARDRRASMYSQAPRGLPYVNNPPPPHMPQAHFYGTPDFDFGLRDEGATMVKPGQKGYFCGYDTLGVCGHGPSLSAENVLLNGLEGGLEVFRVEKEKLDVIGHIEGLRGNVIGAKIVPSVSRADPLVATRPLVALVLHGPVLDDTQATTDATAIDTDADDSQSERSRPTSRHQADTDAQLLKYQTSVEVYALRTGEKVATLYNSPLVEAPFPLSSPYFEAPPPVGDLRLDAAGNFVAVASGTSGEVFIFAPETRPGRVEPSKFRYVGKFWTFVQVRDEGTPSSSASSTEANSHSGDAPQRSVPVFSLSHRWLAVVPPASSSSFSLGGDVPLPYNKSVPGSDVHHAPQQPAVTCALDTPDPETLLNRMARRMTQEGLKGAKWLGEQGLQAWNNWRNKPAGSNEQSQVEAAHALLQQHHDQQRFPPTHDNSQISQAKSASALVSVYDLRRLVDVEPKAKNALTPLATFPVALGCSFLSFGPSGLVLLTVSEKGDSQVIWDLMHMRHGKNTPGTQDPVPGPHVREIWRHTRMTVATVVDVAWSSPNLHQLAVLTEKGTVHTFELPSSAVQWPPARRLVKPKERRKSTPAAGSEIPQAKGVSGRASAAFGSFTGTISALRSRGSNLPNLSSLTMTSATPAKGGRAVAAGVTKSIAAASDSVNDFRHAGDNKLHLGSLAHGFTPGSVRWLTGKDRGFIAVVAGGVVRIHGVTKQMFERSKGKPPFSTLVISKIKAVEFPLPAFSEIGLAPAVLTVLRPAVNTDTEDSNDGTSQAEPIVPTARWSLKDPTTSKPRSKSKARPKKVRATGNPLAKAEIETTPAYQPFHADRRMSLFTYLDFSDNYNEYEQDLDSDPHHVDSPDEPWVFGGSIPAVKLSTASSSSRLSGVTNSRSEIGDNDEAGFAAHGLIQNVENQIVKHSVQGEEEEVTEKVVVTTRRRRTKLEDEGDDGFFEDDCEVLDYFSEDKT